MRLFFSRFLNQCTHRKTKIHGGYMQGEGRDAELSEQSPSNFNPSGGEFSTGYYFFTVGTWGLRFWIFQFFFLMWDLNIILALPRDELLYVPTQFGLDASWLTFKPIDMSILIFGKIQDLPAWPRTIPRKIAGRRMHTRGGTEKNIWTILFLRPWFLVLTASRRGLRFWILM